MKLFFFFVAVFAIFTVTWFLNQYAAENTQLKAENEALEQHNIELWDRNIHLQEYYEYYSIEEEQK